jgi:hypothetical protein
VFSVVVAAVAVDAAVSACAPAAIAARIILIIPAASRIYEHWCS